MTEVLQEQLASLVDQIGSVIPAGKPRTVCAHMIPVLRLQMSGVCPPTCQGSVRRLRGTMMRTSKMFCFLCHERVSLLPCWLVSLINL